LWKIARLYNRLEVAIKWYVRKEAERILQAAVVEITDGRVDLTKIPLERGLLRVSSKLALPSIFRDLWDN